MTRFTILLLVMLGGPVLQAQDAGPDHPARETYVAVFLVRGSVAGANRGEYGLFRRKDDQEWERLSLSNVISFGVERVMTADTERLFLAAGNGLHRSTDHGASWRILTSWETMEIMHVQTDPRDPSRIWVGTPWGVYRSTDNGASWEETTNGMRRWFISDLEMAQGDPGPLYASSEDDLYRTTDGGEHWSPLGVGEAPINVIGIHPKDPARLLAAAEDAGIRLSDDGGLHWRSTRGLEQATVYALAFSPDGKRAYAAGWQTGLWQSTDAGEHWTRLWDAPGIEAIFCLAVDPLEQEHLLMGTDGQGVLESTDGGVSWKSVGLDGAKIKDIKIYAVN